MSNTTTRETVHIAEATNAPGGFKVECTCGYVRRAITTQEIAEKLAVVWNKRAANLHGYPHYFGMRVGVERFTAIDEPFHIWQDQTTEYSAVTKPFGLCGARAATVLGNTSFHEVCPKCDELAKQTGMLTRGLMRTMVGE